MRFIPLIIALFGVQLAQAQGPAADAEPVQHEFIVDFKTEGGAVLPEARIVYGTYGHLDAAATTPFSCLRTTWPTCMAMAGSSDRARRSIPASCF